MWACPHTHTHTHTHKGHLCYSTAGDFDVCPFLSIPSSRLLPPLLRSPLFHPRPSPPDRLIDTWRLRRSYRTGMCEDLTPKTSHKVQLQWARWVKWLLDQWCIDWIMRCGIKTYDLDGSRFFNTHTHTHTHRLTGISGQQCRTCQSCSKREKEGERKLIT